MEANYSRELERHGLRLSFSSRRLEDDFLYLSHIRTKPRLRTQIILGILLILSVSLLDWISMPREYAITAIQLRAIFMLPPVIAMLALSYFGSSRRLMNIAGVIVGLSVGLVSLLIGSFGQRYGVPLVASGFLVITVYIYFFLGLGTWMATGTAAILIFVFLSVGTSAPGGLQTLTIYNGYFLLFMNILCCVGAHQLEEAQRDAFIREHILEYQANSDAMTGLSNRKAFDQKLPSNWQQCIDNKMRLSMLLIDIDHFKLYNDQYGHQMGDDAIRAVANVLSGIAKRPNDIACRYGGEEFAILLPDAHFEYAEKQAELLCQAVRDLKLPHAPSPTEKFLTVSVGVAVTWPHQSERSMGGFVQTADEALYSAKRNGRNKSVVTITGDDHVLETGTFRPASWPAI